MCRSGKHFFFKVNEFWKIQTKIVPKSPQFVINVNILEVVKSRAAIKQIKARDVLKQAFSRTPSHIPFALPLLYSENDYAAIKRPAANVTRVLIAPFPHSACWVYISTSHIHVKRTGARAHTGFKVLQCESCYYSPLSSCLLPLCCCFTDVSGPRISWMSLALERSGWIEPPWLSVSCWTLRHL